jgi:hypothetical protein
MAVVVSVLLSGGLVGLGVRSRTRLEECKTDVGTISNKPNAFGERVASSCGKGCMKTVYERSRQDVGTGRRVERRD